MHLYSSDFYLVLILWFLNRNQSLLSSLDSRSFYNIYLFHQVVNHCHWNLVHRSLPRDLRVVSRIGGHKILEGQLYFWYYTMTVIWYQGVQIVRARTYPEGLHAQYGHSVTPRQENCKQKTRLQIPCSMTSINSALEKWNCWRWHWGNIACTGRKT